MGEKDLGPLKMRLHSGDPYRKQILEGLILHSCLWIIEKESTFSNLLYKTSIIMLVKSYQGASRKVTGYAH